MVKSEIWREFRIWRTVTEDLAAHPHSSRYFKFVLGSCLLLGRIKRPRLGQPVDDVSLYSEVPLLVAVLIILANCIFGGGAIVPIPGLPSGGELAGDTLHAGGAGVRRPISGSNSGLAMTLSILRSARRNLG